MQPALHSTAQNSLSAAGGILFERKLQICRWCGAWICLSVLSVCLCYEVNTGADDGGILGTQLGSSDPNDDQGSSYWSRGA